MNFPFFLLQTALLSLVSCLVFSTVQIQSHIPLPFLTTKHCLATERKNQYGGAKEKKVK